MMLYQRLVSCRSVNRQLHSYVKSIPLTLRKSTQLFTHDNTQSLFHKLRARVIATSTKFRPKVRISVTPKNVEHYQSNGIVICLGLGLGSVGLVKYVNGHVLAECKKKDLRRSRLVGAKENEERPAPKFNWMEFFRILWPEALFLIGAVISAFLVALVNIKIPLFLGDIVNVVSKFTIETADNFLPLICRPALNLICYYGLQGLLTFSYISLLSYVGEHFAARLRTRLFSSLLRQDIAFFDAHMTGELVDRLTSDVQDFKSSFKLCISQGLKATTQTIGCVISLLLLSPKLTAISLIIIPAIVGGGALLGTELRVLSKDAQSQVAKASAVADEAIGNVRTVRAFAMEPKENELYAKEVDDACRLNNRLGLGIAVFQGLANVALNSLMLGVLFTGGWMMSTHQLTAGDLMSFLVATQTIERSLAQMSMLFGQAVRGLTAGARVFEFITLEPEIPLHGGVTVPFHSLLGNLDFNNVTFSYPTRPEHTVLKDFNLSIPGGKVVALVGLSGGGKSTVAALLERFYDVDAGKITLDGINIKELDPSWLRGHAIGFINQEPVLFATSVLENIRYGRPDATDEEVLQAAKQANAHEFIQKFPQGYGTVLGERGVTVSGGQKQRIAIARALIKNPSVLILDEATSALDAESEKAVQGALDTVIKGRTVLVIAHRLSTVKNADIIAVVSEGKILEIGTHSTLVKKKGLYWELIKQQHIEEEIEAMTHHN